MYFIWFFGIPLSCVVCRKTKRYKATCHNAKYRVKISLKTIFIALLYNIYRLHDHIELMFKYLNLNNFIIPTTSLTKTSLKSVLKFFFSFIKEIFIFSSVLEHNNFYLRTIYVLNILFTRE